MSEPKHTKGPWKYGRKDFLNWDDDLPTIVELPLDYNPRHYSEGAFIYGANGDEIVGCDEYHVFNKPDDIALMLDAWQLPDLRREIKELKEIKTELIEALEAYEKLEADILLNANWNTPSGVPQITQEQFEMLIDCQTIRYNALRKARGESE